MKLSRRTNTIIMWFIAIGLVLGMIITFTPSLGGFGRGGAAADGSAPAIRVNGSVISELSVARARANPLFNLVTDGEVGRDLEHLLVDELVRQELVRQEAARQRVSAAEVRRAVDEFREARGVAGSRNDAQYRQVLASQGFDDETFRNYLREQIRQEKWQASLIEGVEVTDDEVLAYYEANRDLYATEERIRARHIVLADSEEAEAVRLELLAGADAAEVARERSIERADRDGALGAAVGETEPRPVGRPALPTAVANAAFGLRDGGITEVVPSADAFHIVVVEEYLPPAPRPLEEVADRAREDALDAKRAGVLDEEIARLKRTATIEIPTGSPLRYDNVTVARVGDVEIRRSDLVRATYTNPQIQQALSPDTAFIITAFFKPAILDQLIDQELAYQGAGELGVPFVGPRRFVAQTVLNYVARDAAADEDAITRRYEENIAQYTVPASADVVRVTFDEVEEAEAFREDLLGGADVAEAAEAHGGEVLSLGRVERGGVEPQIEAALFTTDAFQALPDGVLEVSDVLVLADELQALPEELEDAGEEGEVEAESSVVVLVAERTPERVRPLSEVRAQVEAAVLAEQRANLREAWLADLRERIEVEEVLAAAPEFDPATFTFPDMPDELEDALPDDGAEGDPAAPGAPMLEITPDDPPGEADGADGDAAEGAADGDAAEGDAAEGDAADGDAAEGDADGDAAEGDAAEGAEDGAEDDEDGAEVEDDAEGDAEDEPAPAE
jgi:parvulin-like peptidyl-prolyl isomerase